MKQVQCAAAALAQRSVPGLVPEYCSFGKTPDQVFKTVQGWEGHQPLPIYPNKTGLFLHMSSALIGACPHQDTDKKRTAADSSQQAPATTLLGTQRGARPLSSWILSVGRKENANEHAPSD
jgi:hypothetical protein